MICVRSTGKKSLEKRAEAKNERGREMEKFRKYEQNLPTVIWPLGACEDIRLCNACALSKLDHSSVQLPIGKGNKFGSKFCSRLG